MVLCTQQMSSYDNHAMYAGHAEGGEEEGGEGGDQLLTLMHPLKIINLSK